MDVARLAKCDTGLAEEIDEIKRRCWGLSAALVGLSEVAGGGRYMDGVEQLMKDVSDSLERLEQKLETQQKETN